MSHPHSIINVKGDATRPISLCSSDLKVIPHICNDVGAWGAGFTGALSKRWPRPEEAFRYMSAAYLQGRKDKVPQGTLQMVQVEPLLWVANMVAQSGLISDAADVPPIRYEGLQAALLKVACEAEFRSLHSTPKQTISFHCPKFGSGLAGGDWNQILEIIKATLLVVGTVYVYEF